MASATVLLGIRLPLPRAQRPTPIIHGLCCCPSGHTGSIKNTSLSFVIEHVCSRTATKAMVGPSFCRSVGLSVRRSVRRSVGRSVRPSARRSVGLSVRRSVGLSVRRFVGPSIRRSVRLSGRRSVRRSVCRSVGLSVHWSVGLSGRSVPLLLRFCRYLFAGCLFVPSLVFCLCLLFVVCLLFSVSGIHKSLLKNYNILFKSIRKSTQNRSIHHKTESWKIKKKFKKQREL